MLLSKGVLLSLRERSKLAKCECRRMYENVYIYIYGGDGVLIHLRKHAPKFQIYFTTTFLKHGQVMTYDWCMP